jgi:hypothetical protein
VVVVAMAATAAAALPPAFPLQQGCDFSRLRLQFDGFLAEAN